ncbi:FMN-dependent alpha-hydroxy acid dehydrogenase [Hymenopellis radicata]|nr:FMN-dependent alpha-hydroxy acid dehydrogenase [Hymenopellis radicata]
MLSTASMSRLLALTSLIPLVCAQFAARPLSAGPWFDGRVQGQALDYGQNDTSLDVETDVASIIDMRDVWTIAERRLNSIVYGRIAGGTSNEDTLHWNVDSYREVHLRPRLLRDITNASIAVNFSLYNGAGEEFPINASSPFFFAPSGSQGLVWPDGELATIGAAAEAGVVAAISSFSTVAYDVVGAAKSDNQTLWAQLYPTTMTRAEWLDWIKTRQEAGYSATVITLDVVSDPLESRNWRAGNEHATLDAPFLNIITWDDVQYLKDNSPLPIVLKGIQTYEDAVLARDIGVAAIYLSNHGNRAADGVQSPLEVLLEIRKNAPGLVDEIPIFIDGGIYTGTNALKAIALGAKMVGLGRPVQFALTMGQAGVKKMIDTLYYELHQQLQLVGGNSLDELDASYVNTLRLDAFIPTYSS